MDIVCSLRSNLLSHKTAIQITTNEPQSCVFCEGVKPSFTKYTLLHLIFQICRSCFSKTKRTSFRMSFCFVISVHFRYPSSRQVPARFVTYFLSLGKKILRFGSVEPSPATVHRTVAFNGSNLSVLDFSKRKRTSFRMSFFFWRYRPDLNWRITVLQTGALPLGYGTI